MAVVTPTYTQSNLLTFTYDDLMRWAQFIADSEGYGANIQQILDYAKNFGVGEEQALLDYLAPAEGSFGIQATKMADGTYSGYIFQGPEQVMTPNPVNSNAGTTSRATIRQMVGQKFDDVEGTLVRTMTRYPSAGGLGQKAAYVFGSIGSAVGAVSTGIWLGKTIDSALYNANPDFWNNIGLSSLNPETWAGLTNGSDSPFAGLLNFVLGIDPESGNAQMYMNQDALAYIAYAMSQAGVFAESGMSVNPSDYGISGVTFNGPINYARTKFNTYESVRNITGYRTSLIRGYITDDGGTYIYDGIDINLSDVDVLVTKLNQRYMFFAMNLDNHPEIANGDDSIHGRTFGVVIRDGSVSYRGSSDVGVATLNGHHYAFGVRSGGATSYAVCQYPESANNALGDAQSQFAYTLLYGSHTESGAIEGITNQDGATLPDTSTWDTPENTLASLQQQYPDAFDNAMTWDNYADDGTPAQTTWIPVPFPNTTFANDTQPTSGEQTQTSINISDLPETLIKVVTEIVQQTQTETEPKPTIPPQNPVDTGTGEPPALVPITGNASALWSVYHPTQQQVNDFGAWLWTDNVIEQFLRLMNNPMEGIISLHKVFGMPVDSGAGTIVVGRLDSGVSTALVTQQYIDVDCGTVSLYEQFANVFDYAPFTNVSLYLPFIGIVPLNVSDTMRSTINIHYGIDVFTGACLATVNVSRDGNTVNLYQYTGVASVQYPLTGAQNSGLLNGLFGIASGVGSIATGNIAGGAAMIAGGAVNAMHTNMSRSGGFSGNSGAMGIKIPYLIIERPQTMVAQTFPNQQGYPTNYSAALGNYTGFVQCVALHVEGVPATDSELDEIRDYLASGVIV